MTRLLAVAALTFSLAGTARAQSDQQSQANPVSSLAARVSAYLNSGPVRRAAPTVAVVAVRGGAPQDLGEDLDVRLLDRAAALRAALLSEKNSPEDAAQLRRVYDALAVSYWVQALGQQPSPETAGQAAQALKIWAARRREPALAPGLSTALSSAVAGFDEKKLVAAGWGAYCRAVTPAREGLAAASDSASTGFDAKTAQLDELLSRLRGAWTGKALSPADRAQAFLLAGQASEDLSQAPFSVRRLSAAQASYSSGAKSSVSISTAVKRPPAAPAVAGPDFSPKAIYDKASRAVVLILCSGQGGSSGEIGSGSILDSRGRILTNAHVVIRDATKQPWPSIRVFFKPARMTGDPAKDLVNPVTARLLAYDASLDLALLDVGPPPAGTALMSFGDSDDVSVGDRVAAIGHPEQGGLWTLTTGIVSAYIADLGGVSGRAAFQTDASINRGNSGGPLLDASGSLVGVNTLMSRRAADGLAITAVNFSIRSDIARRWLGQNGGAPAMAPAPLVARNDPPASPAPDPAPVRAAAAAPRPAPARPAAKLPPAKPVMITESKPYSQEELLRREIQELDDMGRDMENEIEQRGAH